MVDGWNRFRELAGIKLDGSLRREQEAFALPFYELHSRRFARLLRWQVSILLVFAVVACIFCCPIWFGRGDVLAASCAGSVFLYVLLTTWAAFRDFRIAQVLPYFERPLGEIETWLAGRELLWNSHALDEIARDLGAVPLSQFVSGDPLDETEPHAMFDAREALATAENLLEDDATALLGESLTLDLKKLRNALAFAVANDVQFSLHVREGTAVCPMEMSQRKGSYF